MSHYSDRMRPVVVLSVSVLLLAGCSEPNEDDTVPVDAGTATVAAGDELWVYIGEASESVGDNWYLVEEPDSDALVETERVYKRGLACNLGLTGCDHRLYWGFEATAAGETELVFQYCLRTTLEDCEGGSGQEPPEPIELTVTVTE
jgi:hypothetical protein